MTAHLTPVQVCEALLGGVDRVAKAAGVHRTTVFPWRRASAIRDTGDVPGARVMRRILAYSAARGLGLTADHLIWGAPRAEVDEILLRRDTAREAAE
ncbi:hypothetical protein [Thioclava nitratireducens]|uniref:hypothetical protein n=1 Tax=Thioclava nitratireducens TaxID=1915078 RepID=UPI00142FDC6D|nr:hypothetical protein [Thioclava nitratireducens]